MLRIVRDFVKMEASAGILLGFAAAVALVWSNSPFRGVYEALLSVPVAVQIGALEIAKPLLLWINDGLMAVFFLLVGLEIKREVLEGELSSPAKAALPVIAAIGGMAVPAAVFVAINWQNPATLNGWGIPTATDIAFALGVLMLLGPRIPASLKIFLLALAIIDDLGAIVIIAVWYTSDLSMGSLAVAAAALVVLHVLNRRRVMAIAPYVLVGIVLWVAVLKSGVHATLAGVALAFAIPLRAPDGRHSPLQRMEHGLHPWVTYGILPAFALANSGVSLAGLSLSHLAAPLPLGIALGLVLGKQAGVMAFSWAAIRLGVARLPDGATWAQFYGVAVLTGVGFTMSLFIGSLAFADPALAPGIRIGVLGGSACAALWGFAVLRATHRQPRFVYTPVKAAE